jgi:putative intracellular protease/amidase/YHS domain-containing protein
MNRNELLQSAAALGLFYACFRGDALASGTAAPAVQLRAPESGVPVAFLLSDGAVVIDFTGPWEVFQDVTIPGRAQPAFQLYTVAETTAPIAASSGLKIVPQFDFAHAPAPGVVVVPAQSPPTPAVKDWLRAVAPRADVVMSVCTGAVVLAQTGLLDGHTATTHHGSFVTLAMDYPQVTVRRGARFVDEGAIATSAGLSAGIDLALHIVERYFGREIARQTAYYMEYLSNGWVHPDSNAVYAKPPVSKSGHPLCPVCWMDVDPNGAPSSSYAGKEYYFCMVAHKQRFDSAPARFLAIT